MTQSLLDLTTTLFNNKTEGNNLKSNIKDYTESYSNGKSFNDIFSNVNNGYGSRNSNPNLNNNNNDNRNFDDKSKNNNLNSKKENPAQDAANMSANTNNNPNANASTRKTNDFNNQKSNRDSKNQSQDLRDIANDNQEVEKTEVNEDENTVVLKDTFAVEDLKDVNIEDFASSEDILAFAISTDTNSSLTDINVDSEEVVDANLYINAFYQSTLDSLSATEEASTTEEDLAAVEDLVATEDVLEDTLNASSTEDVDTTTTVDFTKTDLKATKESDVQQATDKTKTDLKDETLSKKVDELKPELKDEQDEKLVEVDLTTNEETNKSEDVLVQATDDVIEQAPKVDVNQVDKKASMREALEKAGLSEKEMDALNVTVTEIGNSSTDLSNGFGSQSNAQEDITKLGLQANNKTNQVHTVDKNFAKAVDIAKGEEPKEITKNEILTQISNKMQAQNINGKSKITLMLTPESLGKVTIELTKGKNGMEAKLLTDNAQVKEILEKSIDGLKSTLSDQGLSVNNVSVKVSSANESSSEFSFNRENFNGEGNSEQNSNNANDKKEEKNQFASNKFDEGLEIDGEGLAENEGEIILEDGTKVSSQLGNVDIEA